MPLISQHFTLREEDDHTVHMNVHAETLIFSASQWAPPSLVRGLDIWLGKEIRRRAKRERDGET